MFPSAVFAEMTIPTKGLFSTSITSPGVQSLACVKSVILCHLFSYSQKYKSCTYSPQRKCKRAQRKLAFNLPSAAFLLQRKCKMSAKKACFQFAECSFSSAKIRLFVPPNAGEEYEQTTAKSSIFFFDLAIVSPIP